MIISTLHVHLDHDHCLEVLAVRGKAGIIKRIADELIAAKGVKHGKLTVTTSGKDLPSLTKLASPLWSGLCGISMQGARALPPLYPIGSAAPS